MPLGRFLLEVSTAKVGKWEPLAAMDRRSVLLPKRILMQAWEEHLSDDTWTCKLTHALIYEIEAYLEHCHGDRWLDLNGGATERRHRIVLLGLHHAFPLGTGLWSGGSNGRFPVLRGKCPGARPPGRLGRSERSRRDWAN